MGTRWGVRAVAVIAVGSAVTAVSCLDATEVTLVLTTDLPCGAQQGTSIAVGSPDDVSSSAPVTVTSDCALAGGDGSVDDAGALAVPASIGTMVVVPSGSRSASFAVQIVTAVAPVAQPSDCAGLNYQGCIVERRQISFIPHTPLTVPIEMTLDCLSIPCTASETCFHGKCVTPATTCTPNCTLDIAATDASSDDDAAPGAGDDMTVGNATDATLMDSSPEMGQPDVSTLDAPSADGPADVSTDDVSIADASSESAADVSVKDAAADVVEDVSSGGGSDASDALAPPSDGGIPSDGSPLGSCVAANTSGGVECAGSRCATGEVCCVTFYPSGGQTTEACTSLGACDYNATGSPTYSALACRDIGDCASGTVCCASVSTTGNGSIAQCASSCPYTAVSKTTACQNVCECPGNVPHCNAVTCFGYSIGLCGTALDSFCPL